MPVRCKFKCVETGETEGDKDGNQHSTKFVAVYSGSPENEKYFKWTPVGKLEISGVRKQHFTPGKEYYIDITEAE